MRGIIVKAISGFYYVESDGQTFECKARGVFKNRGITPLVGDHVMFEPGMVNEILPRKNSFERPPVANVDTLVIVMAGAKPDPSFEILDKFIVTAESLHTDVVLCINKCDITSKEIINKFKSIYSDIYPIYFVSAKTGEGIAELKASMLNKQFAFAGPSGVGKSSLTNIFLEKSETEVGEISQKSLRGKNTTRHTQLFKAEGYQIFDTPGFTSFDANLDDEHELENLFPEFKPYLGLCRFDDCRHLEEPECAIRKALLDEKISESRYNSYKDLYKYIVENKRY